MFGMCVLKCIQLSFVILWLQCDIYWFVVLHRYHHGKNKSEVFHQRASFSPSVRFFSRRFMKWNATIIVTLFFLSTRTDQNSSTKVLQNIIASKCTIWSSELNQKGFSCFSAWHTIPGETKDSPLSFFSGTARLFFSKKNFPRRVPLHFLMFCDRMDVEKSQRVPPFSFFRHCEIFSRKRKFFSSIFSCFATEWMLKNHKGPPFQFFGIVRL